MTTRLNSFFSPTKKERVSSRRVLSTIPLLTSLRTSSRTCLHQFLLSQQRIPLSRPWQFLRKCKTSRHTKSSDTRELTNITKEQESRKQRMPSRPRNDHDEESLIEISKMCFIDFITSCLATRSYGAALGKELVAITVLCLE